VPISLPEEPEGWRRPFEDLILLPRGRQLLTLEDASGLVMKLSKAERELPEWQAAGEALITWPRKAKGRCCMRVGMLRAAQPGQARAAARSRAASAPRPTGL
jgi:hypothetical protein